MTEKTVIENRLRLIGYYNRPDQDLNSEQLFCAEAENLATLLEESFQRLIQNPKTDQSFRAILQSKAVFILKSTDNRLSAYFPYKNIARLSNVKYIKDEITPIPLKYKSWFIPGQDIPVEPQKERKYIITTSGPDFLITFDERTLPLDWSEDDYISKSDLNLILHDPWTTHVEFDTDSHCDGCEGNCNNSCFYHRYKRALRLYVNRDAIDEELAPLHEKMDMILAPHCSNSATLLSEINSEISSLEERIDLYEDHFNISFERLTSKLNSCEICVEGRGKFQNATEDELIDILTSDKLLRTFREDLNIRDSSFLFWNSVHIEGHVYDIITDSVVTFDYKVNFKSKKERKCFLEAISGNNLRDVALSATNINKFMVEFYD